MKRQFEDGARDVRIKVNKEKPGHKDGGDSRGGLEISQVIGTTMRRTDGVSTPKRLKAIEIATKHNTKKRKSKDTIDEIGDVDEGYEIESKLVGLDGKKIKEELIEGSRKTIEEEAKEVSKRDGLIRLEEKEEIDELDSQGRQKKTQDEDETKSISDEGWNTDRDLDDLIREYEDIDRKDGGVIPTEKDTNRYVKEGFNDLLKDIKNAGVTMIKGMKGRSMVEEKDFKNREVIELSDGSESEEENKGKHKIEEDKGRDEKNKDNSKIEEMYKKYEGMIKGATMEDVNRAIGKKKDKGDDDEMRKENNEGGMTKEHDLSYTKGIKGKERVNLENRKEQRNGETQKQMEDEKMKDGRKSVTWSDEVKLTDGKKSTKINGNTGNKEPEDNWDNESNISNGEEEDMEMEIVEEKIEK